MWNIGWLLEHQLWVSYELLNQNLSILIQLCSNGTVSTVAEILLKAINLPLRSMNFHPRIRFSSQCAHCIPKFGMNLQTTATSGCVRVDAHRRRRTDKLVTSIVDCTFQIYTPSWGPFQTVAHIDWNHSHGVSAYPELKSTPRVDLSFGYVGVSMYLVTGWNLGFVQWSEWNKLFTLWLRVRFCLQWVQSQRVYWALKAVGSGRLGHFVDLP